MGARPLELNLAVAKNAVAKILTYNCETGTCVRPKGNGRRLEGQGDCHENLWTNPDPRSETTADKAVQAWYSMKEFFDYTTG